MTPPTPPRPSPTHWSTASEASSVTARSRPWLSSRTHRRVHRLLDEQELVLAELCDDHVTARTATDAPAVQEWREWELELVDGPVDLLDAAEPILVESGARPATSTSKLARALADSLPARQIWRSREAPGKDAATAELVSAYLGAQLARSREAGPVPARRGRGGCAPAARGGAAPALRACDVRVALRSRRRHRAPLRAAVARGREMSGARDAQVLRQRLTALVDGQPAELVLGPVRSRLDDSLREQVRHRPRRRERGPRQRAVPPPARPAGEVPRRSSVHRRCRSPARKIIPGLLDKDLRRVRKRSQRYRRAGPSTSETLRCTRSARRRSASATRPRPPVRCLEGRRSGWRLGPKRSRKCSATTRTPWSPAASCARSECRRSSPARTGSASGACMRFEEARAEQLSARSPASWRASPTRTCAPGCAADVDADSGTGLWSDHAGQGLADALVREGASQAFGVPEQRCRVVRLCPSCGSNSHGRPLLAPGTGLGLPQWAWATPGR